MRNKYDLKTLAILLLLVSCSPAPVAPVSDLPLSFNAAIPILANNLMMQVKSKQSLLDNFSKKNIVIDPFMDIKSHEVLKVSQQIEKIFVAETQKVFGNQFSIERLTPKNIYQADYVIHGVIMYEPYKTNGNYYHIISSVIEKNKGKVIAKSDVWISNQTLDYTPIIDSPIVLPNIQSITEDVVTIKVNAKVPANYNNVLEIQAIINKAEEAYGNKDYDTALDLFTIATEQQSFDQMSMIKAYIGLYRTNIILKDLNAAETVFEKIVSFNFEKNGILNVKFIFSVSKTSFDDTLAAEYPLWLRQIGKYFEQKNLCLDIVGHSSHTGKLPYNCQLSLDRAVAIQQKLQANFSNIHSITYGKAWAENLVGSGTDDAQDAIDRRVGFKLASCPISDNRTRKNKIEDCVKLASSK
ncbi:OmpA family protein [Candidatus Marithrix sp. Canyon 246]|uniref:OmpA family protein n=1 Tax=Candidatus Marithrix sp. Canyon 246 TaxID=1827136 RepID=UPI00084A2AB1|nr:OmpA family protein [Candidatus Marithrix sp. Canyon 246]